jgi:beta-lactamase regulating signal transducer with metallopeptidase domain
MMGYFWNILASQGSLDFLTLLALAAAKATLLLAFVGLLCVAFRRLSAATRHLLWAAALCASLLLPLLSFVKMWEVPILPARLSALSSPATSGVPARVEAFETTDARVSSYLQHSRDAQHSPDAGEALPKVSEVQTQAASPVEFSTPHAHAAQTPIHETATPLLPRLLNTALAVWGLGVLLLLLKLLAGFVATNLLTRRAAAFEDSSLTGLFSSLLNEVNLKGRVSLLCSERTSMPIVYGILRPAVLLPAEAELWSEERRRLVLLHELTHVTRRDCLTQMLAQLACAFYWFNPFVWIAARRLRVEREQACDDYVLSIGTKPSDYANHLLEIARSMQERSIFEWSQTTSVAMARRSQLEGRLLAILSKENERGAVPRAKLIGFVALICVLFLSLAAVRPTVIHAHDPRAFDAASNDSSDDTERDFYGSHPAINAGPGRGAAGQDAARALSGERAETGATGGVAQAQALKDAHVEREDEQDLPGDVARITEEEVAEAVVERIATVVPVPDVKPATDKEASPFISAGYRQDRNPQTQDGRGDFIDEMSSSGYPNLSVDELIRLKTAGVTGAYVRSLRALGFTSLTPKELSSMAIHGVTSSYIESLRAAGYNNLSAKELTTFRIHGITPDYIKTLRDAGYGNLVAKQLVEFAVHHVTPAFISGIRAAGYGNLSPKDLVSLRVYAITPEFIRTARARLGELSIRQLISLKNMGILDDEKDKEKSKDKDRDKDKEKTKG